MNFGGVKGTGDSLVREAPRKWRKSIGHVCAILSLGCCASYWLILAYYRWHQIMLKDMVGFHWFWIMCMAFTFAVLAARLGSKLSRAAVPAAILMLLLTFNEG